MKPGLKSFDNLLGEQYKPADASRILRADVRGDRELSPPVVPEKQSPRGLQRNGELDYERRQTTKGV